MDDSLLPGDPADEEDVRAGGVDLVLRQDSGVGRWLVLVQVDAIVDDPDLLVGNAIERVHIFAHGGRDGDHAVGVLVGGLFDPGACVISGAELFDLPRPMGLQRVRGKDQTGTGELPTQAAGEMAVPGVAMDDFDVADHSRHDHVAEHRLLEPLVFRVLKGEIKAGFDALDAEVSRAEMLVAEADDGHLVAAVVDASQLPGEVLDMNPRASIDVRRVFVGKDGNPHRRPPASGTACLAAVSMRPDSQRSRVP